MRLVVLLLALVACKDDKAAKPAPAPASGSAPVAPAVVADAAVPSLDVCTIAQTTLDKATCPTPELRNDLMKAKKSLDGIVQAATATADPASSAAKEQLQVLCAQIVLAIERDAKKINCAVAIDEGQRTEMVALLDAYYARRTPVVKTGDAAADALIDKLAAMRDATCACTTAKCLDQVDKQLSTIGTFSATAPQAARDLAGKLIDDAARCANRVRTITDPPL